MTLLELVQLYDGEATFDVSRAIDGGIEDVITFTNDDYEAVKDAILAEKVFKYHAELAAHIIVILEAADTTTTTPPSDPSGGSTGTP